jgi:hypothetical protein
MKESFAENSEGTSDKPFFMRNPNMPSLSDGSDPCIRIRQTYSTIQFNLNASVCQTYNKKDSYSDVYYTTVYLLLLARQQMNITMVLLQLFYM